MLALTAIAAKYDVYRYSTGTFNYLVRFISILELHFNLGDHSILERHFIFGALNPFLEHHFNLGALFQFCSVISIMERQFHLGASF